MTTFDKWRALAEELLLRQYDPSATVVLDVQNYYSNQGSVWVNYYVRNGRDTTDPDLRMSNDFRITATFWGWPGRKVAADAILGGFIALTTHETMELVTWKNRPHVLRGTDADGNYSVYCYHPAKYCGCTRVHNPHVLGSRNQAVVNFMGSGGNDGPMLLRQIHDLTPKEAEVTYSDACLAHLDELEESYG